MGYGGAESQAWLRLWRESIRRVQGGGGSDMHLWPALICYKEGWIFFGGDEHA